MARKVLYTPDRVRQMFAQLRGEMHAQHAQHLCDLAELRCELNETKQAYFKLRNAVLARENAEAELAVLYREREIQRAQQTARDPMLPLQ